LADDKEDKKPVVEEHSYANVSGVLAAWLVVLFVALLIQYVLTGPYASSGITSSYPIFLSFANFILFLPGSLILPLAVGAALGAEIGAKARSLKAAERAGLINGVYASLVYTIAIIIIYEVLANVLPILAPTIPFLVIDWLVAPIAIVMVLTEIFAVVSHSRKINA